MKKKQMDLIENMAYWGVNVCTLGGLWLLKIIIKKAIIEAHNA